MEEINKVIVRQQPKLTGQIGNTLIYIDPDLEDQKVDILENGVYTVKASEGFDGLNTVEVKADVNPELEEKEITPTKQVQIVTSDEAYGLSKVTVQTIPDEYVIPTGRLDITKNGIENIKDYESVNVYVSPNLQNKSIDIIKNGTTFISADENFDGLGTVEINADVSASPPEKGFIINKFDENGYVNKITVVGFTNIPNWAFYVNSSYPSLMSWYLTDVVLPEDLTNIGENAFMNNIALSIKRFPDTLTWIQQRAFQNCKKMVQFSGKGLSRIDGSATGNPVFLNCTALRAIWVGSNFAKTQNFQTTYAFYKTGLVYIFIDSRRAEVEAASGYNVRWCGTSDYGKNVNVICNDDANFMTQDEFDAIDWSTYTL